MSKCLRNKRYTRVLESKASSRAQSDAASRVAERIIQDEATPPTTTLTERIKEKNFPNLAEAFEEFNTLFEADEQAFFKEFENYTKFKDLFESTFAKASIHFKVSVNETLDDLSYVQLFNKIEKYSLQIKFDDS